MTRRRPTFRPGTLAAAVAGAALWGCSHPIPKYAATGAGANAHLVMRGELQSGEAYGVYLFQDPVRCDGLRQVGIGAASRNPDTTTIAAGLQTAEVFVVKANRSVCRVRWSFESVAGRKYVVTSASTPGGCLAQIFDATDPHNVVLEPSSRRRDVGGRMCVPLAQTTRLGDAESRAAAASEADLPIGLQPPRSSATNVPVVSEDDLRQLQRK